MLTPNWAIKNENSPIGVSSRLERRASASGIPTASNATPVATMRTSIIPTPNPRIGSQTSATSRTSIIMPIETKNTLLNMSRAPRNEFSTVLRCGISATTAPSQNAPSATEYPAFAAARATRKSTPATTIVRVSGSAFASSLRRRLGMNESPRQTSKTTNAPITNINQPTLVGASAAPPPCDASTASMTTATTSSSSVMPIAICAERSCPSRRSWTIFPITAELETMNIAAINRLCSESHPTARPSNRVK
ncbi:MAG: hypothetical protein BWX86_01915 [Verrucomicrobia bacterium ADurb.Bin122]|nr:MAG: hypothetical protein BWX86_01915 [Verrucomicrobia bacterium ADurb.Bin122]